MTAQPRFDGTFSCDAVALAAHALVAQLHDEAMATIAALADGWGRPADDEPTTGEQPVTYQDPATWSVADDELDGYADEDDADDTADDPADDDADDTADADDAVRVVPRLELPPLLPQPRRAAPNIAAGNVFADATTDEFAVPAQGERQYAAS